MIPMSIITGIMVIVETQYLILETLKIIGYVEDDHGQAFLVHVQNNNELISHNEYPHVTIRAKKDGKYGAVYSNTLWERIADGILINIF